MNSRKSRLAGVLVFGLFIFLCGCVVDQDGSSSIALTAPEAQAAPQKAAAEDKAPSLVAAPDVYQLEVRQLTTLECAQCHYTVFADIRDQGGKHQLECRYCHQAFHNMRPGVAWADALPKCTTCHGEIHGQNFLDCRSCHADHHAPIASLVNFNALSPACATCHEAQSGEVQKYVSKHTTVACSDCHHTRHGYKPACTECHAEPHTPYVDIASCEACHPVHSPLEIAYADSTPNTICAGCHGQITQTLTDSPMKHSTLACVFCHSDRHGFIPECQKCHGVPHSQALLDKFGGCLDCHGDPHALKLGN